MDQDRGGEYQRVPGLPWRWFRGVVLLEGPGGQGQQLEGGAAVLWAALGESRSRAELVAEVQAQAGSGVIEASVADALAALVDAGLVTQAQP